SPPAAGRVDAGLFGDVFERPVAVPAIERAELTGKLVRPAVILIRRRARIGAALVRIERREVRDIQIEVAITVVIEEGRGRGPILLAAQKRIGVQAGVVSRVSKSAVAVVD